MDDKFVKYSIFLSAVCTLIITLLVAKIALF